MAQSGQVNPSCHKHHQTMPYELKNRGDLIRNNKKTDGGRFTVWVMKTWRAMAQSGQVNPSCHKHHQTMPNELKNRGDLIRNNQNTDSGKFTV